MTTNVFISYAQEDKKAVERISSYLKSHGISVWNDINLPGQSIANAIEKAIKSSDSVILLLSENTTKSSWAATEAAAAAASKKRVIPILLDQKAYIPSFLKDRLYLDLSEEWTDERLSQLIAATMFVEGENDTESEVSYENLREVSFQAAKEALHFETQHMLRDINTRNKTLTKLSAFVATISAVVSVITAIIALMGGL